MSEWGNIQNAWLRKCSVQLRKCSVQLRKCSVQLRKCSVQLRKCSVQLRKCSVQLRNCSVQLRKYSVQLWKCSAQLRKCSVQLQKQCGISGGGKTRLLDMALRQTLWAQATAICITFLIIFPDKSPAVHQPQPNSSPAIVQWYPTQSSDITKPQLRVAQPQPSHRSAIYSKESSAAAL